MTLPSLRRMVSANTVRLAPTARATTSRERKKNFFMMTSNRKAINLIDCSAGTSARCLQESYVSYNADPFLQSASLSQSRGARGLSKGQQPDRKGGRDTSEEPRRTIGLPIDFFTQIV